tara:strand:+ start:1365 stop:1754 length:390 start_codon:yes stop_codon:yes gene_type:complete
MMKMVHSVEEIMTKEEISFMISRTLKYGVFLGEQTASQDRRFLLQLAAFINKRKRHNAVVEDESRLLVESRYMDSLFYVDIENNVLSFVPLTDENFFDAFTEVLEYLANTSKKDKNQKIKKEDVDLDWV